MLCRSLHKAEHNKDLTLVLMACLKLLVLMGGGGVESAPPPILFVKAIEKVIRFLSGSFEGPFFT